MSVICDFLDGWDSSDPQHFHELGDYVNQQLQDWGFDPVNIAVEPNPDFPESPAVYDRESDTIYLNPDSLDMASSSAVDLALHEGLHATVDQLGWDISNADEEVLVGIYGQQIGKDLREKCKELESYTEDDDDFDEDEDEDPPRPKLKYPWKSGGH